MASKEQYQNFMTYSAVCCLMTDPSSAAVSQRKQRKLLEDVVNGLNEIYGDAFMTYNAHVNLHFHEIVKWHGNLDSVSAYPFENHMRFLKKYVTSSHNALVSMIKGIQRRQSVEKLKEIVRSDSRIYFVPPNNVYIDKVTHRCFQSISYDGSKIKMIEYLRLEQMFTDPIDSFDIGCYVVHLKSWRYIYVDESEVTKLRRGIQIPLQDMPGMDSPDLVKDKSVFLSSLHDEEVSL